MCKQDESAYGACVHAVKLIYFFTGFTFLLNLLFCFNFFKAYSQVYKARLNKDVVCVKKISKKQDQDADYVRDIYREIMLLRCAFVTFFFSLYAFLCFFFCFFTLPIFFIPLPLLFFLQQNFLYAF